MLMHAAFFISGIVILYAGGMVFIRGSSGVARIFNIRPVIIGVVVVAFATSAPEFCVSVLAALGKSQPLAVGVIIGSCICNIGLALGLSAIIRPIKLDSLMLRREIPFLLVATLLLVVFSIDMNISRFESAILLLFFILFIFYCIQNAKNTNDNRFALKQGLNSGLSTWLPLFLGLAGLLGGSYMVVNSSVFLARSIGISELVIGLSMVAIGTSLPELFASISAARQGEGDIGAGNIIGSNIFNILAITGIIGIINPISLNAGIALFSLPVLLLFTIALVPIAKTGYTISRKEGMALLSGYLVYLWKVFKI